jgi:hypothetical protein
MKGAVQSMSRMLVRSVTSTLASATRGRVRLLALVAAVALALATVISAVTPSAQADDACTQGGYLYHFQNYTSSGKTLKVEGYAGPSATGTLMVTCSFHIRGADFFTTRGGEAWIPYDVQSVKVTSWSDHGGDPVSAGPYDNSGNFCFRINRNASTRWELSLVDRGPTCNNK